jgi:hypothetical protein
MLCEAVCEANPTLIKLSTLRAYISHLPISSTYDTGTLELPIKYVSVISAGARGLLSSGIVRMPLELDCLNGAMQGAFCPFTSQQSWRTRLRILHSLHSTNSTPSCPFTLLWMHASVGKHQQHQQHQQQPLHHSSASPGSLDIMYSPMGEGLFSQKKNS